MNRENFKYNSEETFFDWLSHLEKEDGSKRYTAHTIDTYNRRLRLFASEFFENGVGQLEREILLPVMACCLCEALQEPSEMLKGQEIQLLADAFFDENLMDFDNLSFEIKPPIDKFEKMVSFLCQKRSGVKYQNVLSLFFDFLNEKKQDGYSTLYQKIEQKLKNIHQKGLVYLKYGYIEATQTTPALIIARGGQDYISVLSLQNIFACDRRTITRMLKAEKIKCCHHRKELQNLSDINKLLKNKHPTQQIRYNNRTIDPSEQEIITVHVYKTLCHLEDKLSELKNRILKKEDLFGILRDINRELVRYQKKVESEKSLWQDSKVIAKQIGKTVRAVQKRAKSGAIPTIRLFSRKNTYFGAKSVQKTVNKKQNKLVKSFN